MTVKRIIQEAINESPLGLKEALEEELRNRVRLALEAKMEDDDEEDDDEEDDDEDEEDDMKKESVELSELDRKTLASYVKKAAGVGHHNTLPNAMRDRMTAASFGDKEWYKKSGRIADNRSKGIQRAADRLAKESFDLSDYTVEELEDFMMSEDFEQLDEISKETVASYAGKAFRQANTLLKHSLSDQPKSVEKASKAAFKRRQFGIKAAGRRLDKDQMKAIHAASQE